MAQVSGPAALAGLFSSYQLDNCFDEMFEASGQPRPQYRALFNRLMELPADDLRKRQRDADRTFLQQGITFTVYGDQGRHRAHLSVRPAAAHADGRRVEDDRARPDAAPDRAQSVPARHLSRRPHPRRRRRAARAGLQRAALPARDARALSCARHLYVSVAGTDLVRLPDGSFAVLEDNLRVPSGVSYMLTNRQIIKRVFPQLFERLRDPADRSLRSGAARDAALARAGAARRADDRAAHARRLQLGLLRARVPRAADGHRAGRRPRPPRPRQRRLHAHDRRPAPRRRHLPPRRRRLPRSAGVPRRLVARRRRDCSTRIAPATSRSPTRSAPASRTTRRSTPTCRRSSSSTWAKSRSCRTSRPICSANRSDRAYVLEHLDELVVKAVGESGGYGMLIGPHARPRSATSSGSAFSRIRATTSRSRRWRCRARRASSRNAVEAASRRSAAVRALFGERCTIVPGGLTRVALRRGSLVVNSSQGGGSKDTWVLVGVESDACCRELPIRSTG